MVYSLLVYIIITIIINIFSWIYYQVIITDEVTKLEKFK